MTTGADQWDIVTSVGLTALGVAAARAIENEREDALAHDSLAARFVAAADAPATLPTSPDDPAADSSLWRALVDFMALRTRFLDDVVDEAVAAGVTQVVVLAAGLDVRAHRLDGLDGVTLFEVDQSRVLAFKDEVLDAAGATTRCDRRVVEADLREDWPAALAAAGHDAARPTLWLAEGLLPYLPADAEASLFERITERSAPGSRVGVEFVRDIDEVLRASPMKSARAELGADLTELWNREPRRPADEALGRLGWTGRAESGAETAARYGRTLDPVTVDTLGAHGMLFSASRT